jgi:hypothetical protein
MITDRENRYMIAGSAMLLIVIVLGVFAFCPWY